MVENYEDNPKMFYKFVNSKRKIKDTILRVKVGNHLTEDDREIKEKLN